MKDGPPPWQERILMVLIYLLVGVIVIGGFIAQWAITHR